jgi:addiction module RelB/DinJ family antitoxin
MDTAVIQIRTDEKLKLEAQKVAEELGFSLSSLIKAFLKNVTRTKSVTFTTDETPSPWLIKQLKQAEKDIKNGDYHSFDTPGESLKFLQKQLK